jgi:hypothetical protein
MCALSTGIGQAIAQAPLPGAQTSIPDESNAASEKPQMLETGAKAFSLGASEAILTWDAWHHKVGRTMGKRATKLAHGAKGWVLIHVRIDRQNKVEAELVKYTGDASLALSTLTAVKSLNGDPVVGFPPESKRGDIQFNFEYKRGNMVFPKHDYIKDDVEKVDGDDNNSSN